MVHGHGFINGNDTSDEVFVHRSALTYSKARKVSRSVRGAEFVLSCTGVGHRKYDVFQVDQCNNEPFLKHDTLGWLTSP